MSTLTLQISVSNVFKKFTVAKTLTVNQLIEQIGEKFAIKNFDQYPDASLVIINNNKKLDKLLPLRLTNLINNARLKLVLGHKAAASEAKTINLKVVVNKIDKSNFTTILVEQNTVTVEGLLGKVEEKSGLSLLQSNNASHRVVVNVLETKLVVGEDKIDRTLSSITGNVSSVVIRVDFLTAINEQRDLEQQRINQLQLDNQKQRNLEQERQRQLQQERDRELQERERALDEREKELRRREGELQKLDKKLDVELEDNKQDEMEVDDKKDVIPDSKTSSSVVASKQPAVDFSGPVSKDPQLFKPSAHQSYENPDEDYEVTVSQIQKYQKLISSSVKPKSAAVRQKPSSYTIRVKFPNQSILQLYFDNGHEVKLGQLLKKIDELLIEKYVNSYNLKLGFPPFNKLAVNFTTNNKLLNDLPDFQTDKITLIWELGFSEYNHEGPFLKEDNLKVQQSNQLPEMVLESHRGELEDEEVAEPKPPAAPKQLAPKVLGSKVPKWFKPK